MSETPGEMPDQIVVDQEQTTEEEPFDLTRAMTTIRALRAEAKAARAQLKDLEQLRSEKQQRDQAALSELERAQQRATQLEADLTSATKEAAERELDYAIERHAASLGIVDPEAARLLMRRADLEFDQDGRPTNIASVLTALTKERPYLQGQAAGQQPGVSVGNPATRVASASGQQQIRRSQLQDYGWYSKHREQVLEAYRTGNIVDG